MPRHNPSIQGLIGNPSKTRKRGCSSSSSSSSVLQNYRFKKAILVGKPRAGSRSSKAAPSWKLMRPRSPASALRIASGSPKYPPPSSRAAPAVSARKLAATLWEMNEMPSPRVLERVDERKATRKEARVRERATARASSVSLPSHLSDPSHSPVSERMDRSGTGNRRRREPSFSQMFRSGDRSVGVFDSVSNGSRMEIETVSRCQAPSGSAIGAGTRLKDVSNALTTSKELLKIINRIWGREELPSSSTSLIAAMHAELERARLQVNQLIQEQRSDRDEIDYIMKCFAEEKAAWRNREKESVEAAVEFIAGELEEERKLRRRLEGFNKKLGRDLAETRASLLVAVKELENEVDCEADSSESEVVPKEILKNDDAMPTASGIQRNISDSAECHGQAREKGHRDDLLSKWRKGFRGQVLSRLGSAVSFASPTRQWGQSSPLRDPGMPGRVLRSGPKPKQMGAKTSAAEAS